MHPPGSRLPDFYQQVTDRYGVNEAVARLLAVAQDTLDGGWIGISDEELERRVRKAGVALGIIARRPRSD